MQLNSEVKRKYLHSATFKTLVKILSLSCLITACGGPNYKAPVVNLEQPPSLKISHHTVARGETLYSIAWRYNMEFKDLARANGLSEPYILRPGQRLNLDLNQLPPVVKVETTQPNQVKTRSRSQPSAARDSAPGSSQNIRLDWQWPAGGALLSQFSGPQGFNKGIDISGKKGDPVLAAESGTVVYAGSGLRGYGQLIIVKHNEKYLSAYAHNDKLLAAEGDPIKAGQKIAEIGSTGTDRNKLHFEIRLEGKPVDPLGYLPSR